MTGVPRITDRKKLTLQRHRGAIDAAPFLHAEAAGEIKERLAEVNKGFSSPLLIGHATPPIRSLFPDAGVVEDALDLGLPPGKRDLILHSFALHWADDPIGQMVQSRLALRPDGLFLAAFFGGETLTELRASLSEAEVALTGGLSPRILPMGELRAMGDLLARAGFALPVADSWKIRVRYPNLRRLVSDLRAMGETNALKDRHKAVPHRDLFRVTESIYRDHFSDGDHLLATFEIVFLTGWAPAATQPKPLRPGSASHRLADSLNVEEHSAGDPVAPRSR